MRGKIFKAHYIIYFLIVVIAIPVIFYFDDYFNYMSEENGLNKIKEIVETVNSLFTPIIIALGAVTIAFVPIILGYNLINNRIYIFRKLYDFLRAWILLIVGLIVINGIYLYNLQYSTKIKLFSASFTWLILYMSVSLVYKIWLINLVFEKYKKNYVQKDRIV